MSKTLVKIVDASLFPAALMITGKFLGLYLTVKIFNLEWGIDNNPNTLFSSRPVLFSQDIQVASSYSDLFLLLAMLLGFSYYVIKAVFFHNTHASHKIVTRLAVNGLISLVKDSFEIYHRATVWLVFLWLTNLSILINTLLNKTYVWVLIIAFTSTVALTVILLRDVAYEISITRRKFGGFA